jgi:hypothetical protein
MLKRLDKSENGLQNLTEEYREHALKEEKQRRKIVEKKQKEEKYEEYARNIRGKTSEEEYEEEKKEDSELTHPLAKEVTKSEVGESEVVKSDEKFKKIIETEPSDISSSQSGEVLSSYDKLLSFFKKKIVNKDNNEPNVDNSKENESDVSENLENMITKIHEDLKSKQERIKNNEKGENNSLLYTLKESKISDDNKEDEQVITPVAMISSGLF